ncbi:MAG: ferrous iron transporter B [Firmicutes bacterium]|nr:ferrous iron transporter B [Bacillota bacterium]
MKCHLVAEDTRVSSKKNKILLMGTPNVGKSVFFSALTNVHVISSNYTGTTVSYMEGAYKIGDKEYTLIDVPGTYSLAATSVAEEVAIRFLCSNPDAVLFVLNAADLEGSIKLALEVMEYNIPMVFALNLMDVSERKGFKINTELLAEELGAPVIPTVAVKGQGITEITKAFTKILEGKGPAMAPRACATCAGSPDNDPASGNGQEYWERARQIVCKVVSRTGAEPSFLDRLGDAMLRPWPGILLAMLTLLISLGVVVGGGKALRAVLLLPLVNQVIVPFFERLITPLNLPPVLHNILIGNYGIFRISFEWILALVMPYVILFQAQFALLEDSGVLPRIAVLFDNLMRKLGVQGGSLIQIFLGFGCAVPAIIGTRTATTHKERLMITAMICFAVPCISQTGALISLLSAYSAWLVVAVALTGFVVFVTVGMVLRKTLKGDVNPLVLEVPNLLLPEPKAYFKKLWVRIRVFLVEAEGPMLIAVFLAAVLAETGLLASLGELLKPVVSGWLGLPEGAVISLILGIIRREMSVAPLLGLNLNPLQMYVGAVVSLLYLPCLSVFGIVAKEFNVRTAVAIAAGTTLTALFVGGLMNHIALLVQSIF